MSENGMCTGGTERQPIIAWVVDYHGEMVTMCGPCGAEEITRESEIRDSDAYGDKVPYPECYKCGGVARPSDPPRNQYKCNRCEKRFDSIKAVSDHSSSHSGEVDVPLFDVVERSVDTGGERDE